MKNSLTYSLLAKQAARRFTEMQKQAGPADLKIVSSLATANDDALALAIANLREDISNLEKKFEKSRSRPGNTKILNRLQAELDDKTDLLFALQDEQERRSHFFRRNWPLLAAVPVGIGTGLLGSLTKSPVGGAITGGLFGTILGNRLGLLRSYTANKPVASSMLLGALLSALPGAVTGGIAGGALGNQW